MYEIYAYGNNDSLYGIFNAIAAIMGANSYLQAIAMVAFCGFVTAGIAYAFMPHKLIGWQWLASVLLVYSILFVPKVTHPAGAGGFQCSVRRGVLREPHQHHRQHAH